MMLCTASFRHGMSLSLLLCWACISLAQGATDSREINTLIIQPGPATGVDAQATFGATQTNQNFGKGKFLEAFIWTDYRHGSARHDGQAYIRFDPLQDLPFDLADLISVELTLFGEDGYPWTNGGQYGPNVTYLLPVLEPWDESTLTWANQPKFAESGGITIPRNNDYDSIRIDITPLVLKTIDPHYGYVLKPQSTDRNYRSMIFCSSDYPEPAKRPKLTIRYYADKKPKPTKKAKTEKPTATETPKTLAVSKRRISIQVWDHNKVDGDIISLYLNDKSYPIIRQYEVSKDKARFYVTLEPGENQLIFVAENEGRMSPNTAALLVDDGVKPQTVILQAPKGGQRIVTIQAPTP